MAWTTIPTWLIRHLAAINVTLLSYIKADLQALGINRLCFSGDDVTTTVIPKDDSWTTVKTGIAIVPSWAQSLKIKVEAYMTDYTTASIRIRVADDAGGWNVSDTATPSKNNFAFRTLSCPSSGDFADPGGYREFEVQVKQTDATIQTCFVRNLLIVVDNLI